MKVGYSRISDERQLNTDPLKQATHELEKAGCDKILVEVGSGTSDAARPKFRQLRELVLDRKATQVVVPSQDRLGRNLNLVMDFVQLCHMQGVELLDLNGRQLEVKTADGTLMTQLIGALDQHRSALYSEKTRRHLQAAREQGMPARPRLPFGLRKIRNDAGRFVGIELDPVTAPIARQRVDWFLKEGLSLTALCVRINRDQPDHPMQMRQLRSWLMSPLLTGRLAWHKDNRGFFTEIAEDQSFPALITDPEHDAIKVRVESFQTNKGVRGRTTRIFTGLVQCSTCGHALSHKVSGTSTLYLRCSNAACAKKGKQIRVDRVFACCQYALPLHAETLLQLLDRPRVDPPEVLKLQAEIQALATISGTEAVIEAKRAEITQLRGVQSDTPAWALIGALRSVAFWSQPDETLNRQLRFLLESITVDLGDTVASSKVASIRCRTSPAEAPLPENQDNFLRKFSNVDLELLLYHGEQIKAALQAIA
nr:hypothetical protein 2 [bacterium]